MAQRFCTSCGSELPGDARFCGNCGEVADGVRKTAPPAQAEPPEGDDPYPIDTILRQTIAALLILTFVIAVYIGFFA